MTELEETWQIVTRMDRRIKRHFATRLPPPTFQLPVALQTILDFIQRHGTPRIIDIVQAMDAPQVTTRHRLGQLERLGIITVKKIDGLLHATANPPKPPTYPEHGKTFVKNGHKLLHEGLNPRLSRRAMDGEPTVDFTKQSKAVARREFQELISNPKVPTFNIMHPIDERLPNLAPLKIEGRTILDSKTCCTKVTRN